MAIPLFDSRGVLPPAAIFAEDEDGNEIPSGHACSLADLEDRFVNAYPQSISRPALYAELRRMLDEAKKHFKCLLLVVSGEFVTDAESPQQIHIVLDVPGLDMEKLDGGTQWILDRLFGTGAHLMGADTELKVHTAMIRAYPPDHRNFPLSAAERAAERYLASEPIDGMEDSGYLEILDCEEGLKKVDEIFAPPTG